MNPERGSKDGSQYRQSNYRGFGSMSRKDGKEVPDLTPAAKEEEAFRPVRHLGEGFPSMHRKDGKEVIVEPEKPAETPCPTGDEPGDGTATE